MLIVVNGEEAAFEGQGTARHFTAKDKQARICEIWSFVKLGIERHSRHIPLNLTLQ